MAIFGILKKAAYFVIIGPFEGIPSFSSSLRRRELSTVWRLDATSPKILPMLDGMTYLRNIQGDKFRILHPQSNPIQYMLRQWRRSTNPEPYLHYPKSNIQNLKLIAFIISLSFNLTIKMCSFNHQSWTTIID